jgi:hypothetical protein
VHVAAARATSDCRALRESFSIGCRQFGDGAVQERGLDGGREEGEELLDNLIIL